MYARVVTASLLRSLPLLVLVACASTPAPEGYEAVEPDAEDLSAFDEDEPPEPAPADDSGQAAAAEAGPDSSEAPEASAPQTDATAPPASEAGTDGEAPPASDAKKK